MGKETAKIIEDLVNSTGFQTRKVGYQLSRMHRYLVNEFFKMCWTFMNCLAKYYAEGFYDGRNEFACKMSYRMIQSVKDIWLSSENSEYDKMDYELAEEAGR